LSVEARHRQILTTLGKAVAPISRTNEVYLGAQLDQVVREHYEATSNTALQSYVSMVGKKVTSASSSGYPFSFAVLDAPRSANAFSSPGGFIYLTTGMLAMLENEAQLAAIMAHEVAHVIRRHGVKQMQEREATNLAIAMLSRVTAVERYSKLVSLGELVLFQRFSREDEYEADNLGVRLLVRAGYNPTGMTQLLHKLSEMDSRGITLPFLDSHPSSQSRSRIMEEYIQRNRLVQLGQLLDTPTFHQAMPGG
jgi:predicted Zn-dependent protease